MTANILTATYADDTTFMFSFNEPMNASCKLQNHLHKYSLWLKKWNVKRNNDKSTRIAFRLKKRSCPSVRLLNDNNISLNDCIKYVGLRIDQKIAQQS